MSVYCTHKSVPGAVHSVINYFAYISLYKKRDGEAFHYLVPTNKSSYSTLLSSGWSAAAIFGFNMVVWRAGILQSGFIC